MQALTQVALSQIMPLLASQECSTLVSNPEPSFLHLSTSWPTHLVASGTQLRHPISVTQTWPLSTQSVCTTCPEPSSTHLSSVLSRHSVVPGLQNVFSSSVSAQAVARARARMDTANTFV